MKEKLELVIAALEVEAAMIELHAQSLLAMVPSLAGDEQRHEMLQLAFRGQCIGWSEMRWMENWNRITCTSQF